MRQRPQSTRVTRAINLLRSRGWSNDKIIAHAALMGFRFDQMRDRDGITGPDGWYYRPCSNGVGAWDSLYRAAMAALLDYKRMQRYHRKLKRANEIMGITESSDAV